MDFLCVFPVILPFEPNMLAKAKTNVLGCHREWIFSPPAEDAVHRDILRSCAKKWNVRKSQCSTIGLKIHHLKCHTHILKSKWFIGDDLQMHSHQSKSSTFWNRFEAHCDTQTSLSPSSMSLKSSVLLPPSRHHARHLFLGSMIHHWQLRKWKSTCAISNTISLVSSSCPTLL